MKNKAFNWNPSLLMPNYDQPSLYLPLWNLFQGFIFYNRECVLSKILSVEEDINFTKQNKISWVNVF